MTRFTNFFILRALLIFSVLLSYLPVSGKGAAEPLLLPGTEGGQNLMPRKAGLFFIENKGQITGPDYSVREDIAFRLSSGAMHVFIGNNRLHYQWNRQDGTGAGYAYGMDVTLLGANPHAQWTATEKHVYEERRISGDKPAGTLAAAYREITCHDVYPGIDWVLYISSCNGKEVLEYDFVIRPGGKVSDIVMQYDGATHLEKGGDGSLTVITPEGNITEHAPYSFQVSDRQVVASHFLLEGNKVRFVTGSYEGSLVIDPTVAWATYFGGAKTEKVNSVVCDAAGNVYIAGETNSVADIATSATGYQILTGGLKDAFLAKYNTAGQLQWATYFGGMSDDIGHSVACDPDGNVYLAGQTGGNISMTGGYQITMGGGAGDAFLVKFNGSGQLLWSSYYGGSSLDYGFAVACDAAGNVYLAGQTQSTDGISSPGNLHQTANGGSNDAFVVKFNASGQRQWGTYLGGTGNEFCYGMTCDAAGVYIAGQTSSSSGIATSGAHQLVRVGTTVLQSDAFLVRFTSAGQVDWGTYYGGAGILDVGRKVVCDASGNVYLAGTTNSDTAIATSSAHQPARSGTSNDAFLVKFNISGQRQWGTYYGGTGAEQGLGLACDAAGDIYLSGSTASNSGIAFAGVSGTNSHQPVSGGGVDAFLIKINGSGQRLWGTYYGGTGDDVSYAVACDATGNAWLAGGTKSAAAIATTGSQQSGFAGEEDAFLAKIGCVITQPPAISGTNSFCATNIGTTVTYSVPLLSGVTSYTWTLPSGWTGASTTNTISATVGSAGGAISVTADFPCGSGAPQTLPVSVSATPVITASGSLVICQGGNVELSTGAVTGNTYQWKRGGNDISGATTASYTATTAGEYVVVVSGPDCSGISGPVTVTVNPVPAATAAAAGPVKFCPGGSVALQANSGAGLTYQWKVNAGDIPGATNAVHTAATSGNYTVVVSNTHACTAMSSPVQVTVYPVTTAIAVPGAPGMEFCPGDSLVMIGHTGSGPGAANYQWLRNSSPVSGAVSFFYTTYTSGDYAIRIVDTNGCTGTSAALTVTAHPGPGALITISGNTILCPGDSMGLQANTGTDYTYLWLQGNNVLQDDTISSYKTGNAGNYLVVVSDGHCTDTSQIVQVTTASAPNAVIAPAGTVSLCAGDSIVLDAGGSGGPVYQWYRNDTSIIGVGSAMHTVRETGDYTVIVTNNSNCSDTAMPVTVTVHPLPVIPDVRQQGKVLYVTGHYSTYQWYHDGQRITGAIDSMYTYVQEGPYTIAVTDSNGCISVSQPYAPVFVGTIRRAHMNIDVFPNPVKTEIYLKASVPVKASLYSADGRKLREQDDAVRMYIGDLPDGVYFLRLTDREGSLLQTGKIIKQDN